MKTNNPLFKGLSGAVGKEIVFKQYPAGTVLTKYPDMSNIKYTPKQKAKQKVFREAVAYAQAVLRDPDKKADYEVRLEEYRTVYHTAISEFMKQRKSEKSKK